MEISFEIVLWFIISLFIGGVIFYFIIGLDYEGLYNGVRDLVSDEDDNLRVEGRNFNQTILDSLKVWKNCGFGEVEKNQTLFLNQSGVVLNESSYVARIVEWNLCDVIAKGSMDCGVRDEVFIQNDIVGPRIISVSCDPINKRLVIE